MSRETLAQTIPFNLRGRLDFVRSLCAGTPEPEATNRMRQMKFVSLGALLMIAALGLSGTMTGCGSGPETSEVTVPPEVKKADEGLQNAMKDMMKGKGSPKAAAKK